MEQLLIVIEELVKEVRTLNANLEAQNRPEPLFLTADEAAPKVGLRVTKSGNHRNRLTAAYKRGLLPKSIPGRPYMFHRDDINTLSKKIATDAVVI